MKVNPNRYFYDIELAMFSPYGTSPNVDLLTLHYTMFINCLQMMGSEE